MEGCREKHCVFWGWYASWAISGEPATNLNSFRNTMHMFHMYTVFLIRVPMNIRKCEKFPPVSKITRSILF